MAFLKWLTVSTARAAARDLAQLHRRCGGDYASVMRLSLAALIMATAQGKVSIKNVTILEHVLSKSIRNYIDLCILFVYVNATTRQRSYEDVYAKFSGKVRHWLLAEGLPHGYVVGDNRNQTNTIVDTLREGLGLKGLFSHS